MNNSIKVIIIFLLISRQFLLSAQESDWINDSLPFYEVKVEAAIEEKNFEQVIEFNKLIANQGFKSLNPKIYDYFYEQSRLKVYEDQLNVLARVHHNIGNLEFYRSNYNAAKKAFNEALELYKQSDNKKSAAGMAMNLAILLEKGGKYDSAIINYKKALPIFEELQDTSTISMVLENLSIAHLRDGNYVSALFYIGSVDSVLNMNTPANSERWVSVYYNKASIYQSMSVFDSALYFVFKGLRLSEELENKRLIISGYSYLNDVYIELEDTLNLKKYILLARAFAEKVEDKRKMGELDFNLGNLYLNQSKIDSATYFAKRGLELAKATDSKSLFRDGYILMGNIYYREKDYQKAINSYELVINNYPSPRRKSMSGIYHSLGNAYMEVGNFEKSNEILNKSLALAIEINVWDRLVETYESLSNNSKKQGRFQEALTYYELYKQYEDSIFNETKSKQIAQVQTEYETEKKDQSIAALEKDQEIQTLLASRQQSQIYLSLAGLLLVLIIAFVFYYRSSAKQKANKALAAKNTEIEEQNKEKEMLLKEIHHRVKNNLQIISSLLSMQTRTLSDSKTIDAMKESQSRVKTMALIHEKLYQYDNLARINMNEYMRQLSDFLSQTYRSEKDIKVIIESENINLDIDTAVPLGLITNELLSNALKYAFADMDQGQVTIKLIKDSAGAYVLTISDSGKGLAADMDIEKSKSLGLKLVRTLTRQINGNLSISSNPGATFSIVFSENQLAA